MNKEYIVSANIANTEKALCDIKSDEKKLVDLKDLNNSKLVVIELKSKLVYIPQELPQEIIDFLENDNKK